MRDQIWRTGDWSARIVELEWEAARIPSPWLRAERFMELAGLAERLLTDPRRALDLYRLAWQATGEHTPALDGARRIARELGELKVLAEVAHAAYRVARDVDTAIIAGEAWLDAGDNDAGLPLLEYAAMAGGESERVQRSLRVARATLATAGVDIPALQRGTAGADPESASHALLCAALIARASARVDAHASLLIEAFERNPRNERAETLLRMRVAKEKRWMDYIELYERAAEVASDDRERVDLYARAGAALTRLGQPKPGTRLLQAALRLAYRKKLEDIPRHLAALSMLRADTSSNAAGVAQLVQLAETALTGPLSDDERLYIGAFAGRLAWKVLADPARADKLFDNVRQLVVGHPTVVKFESAEGASLAKGSGVRTAVLGKDKSTAARLASSDDTRRYPLQEEKVRPTVERRAARRLALAQVASVEVVSRDKSADWETSFPAHTRDVSAAGLFLCTSRDIEVGASLRIALRIPDEGAWTSRIFHIDAKVVRAESGEGVGAEIVDASDEFIERLAELG